ncbi:MAG: hypothetical protein U1F43_03680 [Myxococcota bacterium]
MSPKKQLTVKRPPRKSGTLMGMRSGFRRITGHKDKKRKAATPSSRLSPALQRALVIGVGVIIVIALVWGLGKR